MKQVALILILIFQTTGLWPHLSDHARTNLINRASTIPSSVTNQTHNSISPPPALSSLPIRVTDASLDLPAASALAIDRDTATILYAKNADTKHPIASITKLVTALVILDKYTPEQTLTIPDLPTLEPAAERVGLLPGETYTVGDLIRALLINSGNDAADALALANAGTIPRFAAQMNLKMSQWGITGTRFSNPSGLQDDDNYATAEALAKISLLTLTNPFIRQVVSQPTATITSTTGRTLNLITTNKLLASGEFYGIKTGYTLRAGECFVGLTRVQGHEIITVVLDADSRFANTRQLKDWIDQNWKWL